MIVSRNAHISISVVICTYRRPDILHMAIESLLTQTLAVEEYEIIVVDNNSQDETAAVINKYIQAYPNRIRYLEEKRQGLSYARNAGVKAAQGDIVAFLDDDAEANPDWLTVLRRGYDDIPSAWVIGGKVLPIWDVERPEWLIDDLFSHLSLLDWGEKRLKLEKNEHLPGVNCSFRQETFKVVGYFPTDLGRIAESLLAGEEVELIRKVHQLGKTVYYLPQAIVYHHITKERLTKQYFRRHGYWGGWSRAIYNLRTYGVGFALRELVRLTGGLFIKFVKIFVQWNRHGCGARIFTVGVIFRWVLGYVFGLVHAIFRD